MSVESELARVQSLLQIERDGAAGLRLSLQKEKQLTGQLQQRVQALQRTAGELQQRASVGEKGKREA